MKVASEQSVAMGKRVLVFSSIGHALMHMMTAFYAVIVLTLAVAWDLAPERLLELYAPSAVLLGVMSLPAGWASDRFGAPLMMVVMFVGLGLSSIACGLVATGDTFALMLALCGLGVFGAIYHSVGIGWIIRTAKEQGHAMGVNGLWGSAGPRALRHRARRADHARLVARRLHRAGRRLRRRSARCSPGRSGRARSATGRCPRRPACRPASASSGASSPCSPSPWRSKASSGRP